MHNFLCWQTSDVALTLITNIPVSASAVDIYAMRQVNCLSRVKHQQHLLIMSYSIHWSLNYIPFIENVPLTM